MDSLWGEWRSIKAMVSQLKRHFWLLDRTDASLSILSMKAIKSAVMAQLKQQLHVEDNVLILCEIHDLEDSLDLDVDQGLMDNLNYMSQECRLMESMLVDARLGRLPSVADEQAIEQYMSDLADAEPALTIVFAGDGGDQVDVSNMYQVNTSRFEAALPKVAQLLIDYCDLLGFNDERVSDEVICAISCELVVRMMIAIQAGGLDEPSEEPEPSQEAQLLVDSPHNRARADNIRFQRLMQLVSTGVISHAELHRQLDIPYLDGYTPVFAPSHVTDPAYPYPITCAVCGHTADSKTGLCGHLGGSSL